MSSPYQTAWSQATRQFRLSSALPVPLDEPAPFMSASAFVTGSVAASPGSGGLDFSQPSVKEPSLRRVRRTAPVCPAVCVGRLIVAPQTCAAGPPGSSGATCIRSRAPATSARSISSSPLAYSFGHGDVATVHLRPGPKSQFRAPLTLDEPGALHVSVQPSAGSVAASPGSGGLHFSQPSVKEPSLRRVSDSASARQLGRSSWRPTCVAGPPGSSGATWIRRGHRCHLGAVISSQSPPGPSSHGDGDRPIERSPGHLQQHRFAIAVHASVPPGVL